MSDREALARLLRERSLRQGDFVLSSGERSNYYIDARRTTMSGRGQLLIGRVGLAALDEAGWSPAAVGGLTLGADPVAYAIAHAAAAAGRPLDAFTVRKEPKEHGTGRRIEGAWQGAGGGESGGDSDVPPSLSSEAVGGEHRARPAAAVVVIEDVVTTGASALFAAERIEREGARILGVLALVDREEGGRERLRGAGYDLTAIFPVSELLAGRAEPDQV